MTTDPTVARERAEAAFQKKERQRVEGAAAMAEYEAKRAAEHVKTERLRAQRLAREATPSAVDRA